jgi:tetratricopeptide (TPR) repeat protein
VFAHLALGNDPQTFLLGTINDAAAADRLDGLIALTTALPIIVSGEGDKLRDKIISHWREHYTRISPDYATADEEDHELLALREDHLDILADLCTLCLDWEPGPRQDFLVSEILDFLKAESSFLDTGLLFKKREVTPFQLRLLQNVVLGQLGLPEAPPALSRDQQRQVIDYLAGTLLGNLAFEKYKHDNTPPGIDEALRVLDKARSLAPAKPELQYYAALFYLRGDFYKQASEAIQQFYRIIKDRDSNLIKYIEELKDAIRKADPASSKQFLKTHDSGDHSTLSVVDIREEQSLREAIAETPADIEGYEKLAVLLACAGKMKEAGEISELAITRCLSRAGQIRARTLDLKTKAFSKLHPAHQEAIRLYTLGAHRPLLQGISALPEEDRPYEVWYILGHICLQENKMDMGTSHFQKAQRQCDHPLHFALLGYLLKNIDKVMMESAQRSAQAAVVAQDFINAMQTLVDAMQQIGDAAPFLHELAAIHIAGILANYQLGLAPAPLPAFTVRATWNEALQTTLGIDDETEKVKALITLADNVHPPSSTRSASLLSRLRQLEVHRRAADALERSNELFRLQQHEAALEALEGAGEEVNRSITVMRQRALILLKLERLEEADALAGEANDTDPVSTKQFMERYQGLRTRQLLLRAQDMLRNNDFETALEILGPLLSTVQGDALEIAWSRALAYTLKGNSKLNKMLKDEAVLAFQNAQNELYGHLQKADDAGKPHLRELFNKITQEIETHG